MTKPDVITEAAMWLSEQPSFAGNRMKIIMEKFDISPGQAAQALTLANQFRTNRKAFG